MTKLQAKQRWEVSLLLFGQILPRAPGIHGGTVRAVLRGTGKHASDPQPASPATGNQVSANTARERTECQGQRAALSFSSQELSPLTGLEERRHDPLWGLGSHRGLISAS